ncbi:hypothetical protein [Helicobacter felis]|uniref:hypothetical protein n=3 Tax=Helicobacter felis TaxID=214 RepID=UPI0001EFA462|nr:hypothetical protein [Helicobacter felis]
MKFLIFLLLTLLLNATDNIDEESVNDGSYEIKTIKIDSLLMDSKGNDLVDTKGHPIYYPIPQQFVFTKGDISDSRILKVNTNLTDSRGRSFWDKVFVDHPRDCQKLLDLNPNGTKELPNYPNYNLYYKPTLLAANQGDSLDGEEYIESARFGRVIDVKVKGDIFTIVYTNLIETLSDLGGDLTKSERLRIWEEDGEINPSGSITYLKFLDDNTATFVVDANGAYTNDYYKKYRPIKYFTQKDVPKVYVCPYSAKTLLEAIQKRHPEWKSDSSPHSQ